jgi:flavorubredoxin/flavin reductase (DIM6/NTAB) family NADH-FMN oxidoreductase RutF
MLVKEGDTLSTGRHEFLFVMAPMVHWPEVMFTFDKTDRILFSADAFGTFGALNGALFADELDFYSGAFMEEARRYYANIIANTARRCKPRSRRSARWRRADDTARCTGPVHRGDFWRVHSKNTAAGAATSRRRRASCSRMRPNYGNNGEKRAEILACRLRDAGVTVAMFDVSVDPMSKIVSAAFRYSHLEFAASTYNAGIFITMEELLRDLVLHNIQNRTVALIENGSWAPQSGKLMKEMLAGQKDMKFLESMVHIRSALKDSQSGEMDALVAAITATIDVPKVTEVPAGEIENAALFTLSYGLFVLTAKDGARENGCIINTVTQITNTPKRISIAVNKENLTHDMILKTGVFNVSVLTEESKFDIFDRFGLHSGKDVDKFKGFDATARSANGLLYVTEGVNALMSGKVISAVDYGSHTLFVADLTEARKLSSAPSVTYEYYRKNIRPRPSSEQKKRKAGSAPSAGISTKATFCRRTTSVRSASTARRSSSGSNNKKRLRRYVGSGGNQVLTGRFGERDDQSGTYFGIYRALWRNGRRYSPVSGAGPYQPYRRTHRLQRRGTSFRSRWR